MSRDEERAPLTRERVLGAAMALADHEGIDALSMRRLAQELGIEAMSLYHHVKSKRELLGGIAALVFEEVELPPLGGDWREAIRTIATSYRAALIRHPWASRVLNVATFGVAQMRYMDAILSHLREAGFSPEQVHRAYHALDSHVVGSTLWAAGITTSLRGSKLADVGKAVLRDFPVDDYPDFAQHVREHLSGAVRESGVFQFGLDLILEGLDRLPTVPLRRVPRPRRAAGHRQRLVRSR